MSSQLIEAISDRLCEKQRVGDVELCCFLCCQPEFAVTHTVENFVGDLRRHDAHKASLLCRQSHTGWGLVVMMAWINLPHYWTFLWVTHRLLVVLSTNSNNTVLIGPYVCIYNIYMYIQSDWTSSWQVDEMTVFACSQIGHTVNM